MPHDQTTKEKTKPLSVENTTPQNVDNDSLKFRWRRAWSENRTWRNRILLVFCPSLLISFMLLFWGPVDIIATNSNSLDFTVINALLPLGIAFMTATVLITAVICIFFRGWLLDAAVSFFFSLAVSGYLQGMFMNKDLGLLDGTTINWALYYNWAMLNLAIWGAIMAIVFAARYFHKTFWAGAIKFISSILVLAQLIALISILPDALAKGKTYKTSYYLTTNNEFQLSGKENTVVFVLDQFRGLLDLKPVMERFPDTMDAFHDFTRYDNYAHVYWPTPYAIPYLLTRGRYDPDKPYRDYQSNCWFSTDSVTFYDALLNANYSFQVFTSSNYLPLDSLYIRKWIDNIVCDNSGRVNPEKLVQKMTRISVLRYAPHALKASFWMSDVDFSDIWEIKKSIQTGEPYKINDPAFFKRLKTTGLSLQNQHNSYNFYHLMGPHAPNRMNEFGEYVEKGVEREQQARGSLKIVEEYIRQMKELGIYDRANIIITADHGYSNNPACFFMLKRAGETHEAVQVSNAPITQVDFFPTVASIMGLDSLDMGKPVFEYKEDEVRERTTYNWLNIPEYPDNGGRYNVQAAYTYTAHVLDVKLEQKNAQAIYPIFDHAQ